MSDRLLAYLIDFVLLTVVSFVLWVVSTVLTVGLALGAGSSQSSTGGLAFTAGSLIISLLLWVVIGLVLFGYFTYLDGASGGTLGKRLMDVVVATDDGRPASTKHTAIRTAVLLLPFPVMVLLSFVPFIGFFLALGLMVLWLAIEAGLVVASDDHRRLGDRAAGTRVLQRASAAGAGGEAAVGETTTAGRSTTRDRHQADEVGEEHHEEAEATHDEGHDGGGFDGGDGGGFGGGDGGGGGGE